VIGHFDVVVVGAGPSGIAAAIASARDGARTLLIERHAFPGGMMTAGLVPCINGFRNQRGPAPQAVAGIAQSFVEELAGRDGAYLPPTGIPYCVVIDSEKCKGVSLLLLKRSGASLLFHASGVGPIKEGGRVTGVVIHTKSGRRAVRAGTVVDCTGDGDVASSAGASYIVGRETDGKTLPMQLLFKMASVDSTRLAGYVYENRTDLSPMYDIEPLESVMEAARAGRPFGVTGIRLNGNDSRKVSLVLWKGRATFWASPAVSLNGAIGEEISEAEVQSRLEILELTEKLRRIPGLENSFLEQVGVQIGVRETRRIEGEYVLTEDDEIRGAAFEDSIAVGANPVATLGRRRILPHNGFQIPFRCLLPDRIDGVLVAGRCISTTHEAHGSTRAMATCMATGEAAGAAAALCAETGEIPRLLSVPQLQERLRQHGAILEVGGSR